MNDIDRFISFLKENYSYEKIKVENNNLTVGGSLYLRGTNITELPDNLTVGGSLYLRGTKITELPDNLTVGGSLDLSETNITKLPDNLTVGGSLYLRGTNITELPDNLTVGGSLYLRGTKITELPDNLTVGEYLDLEGTKITKLPDNLTVGGSLDLSGTNIRKLPDNLTVGGNLYLSGTNITNIYEESKKVKRLEEGYNKKSNYIYYDGILWGNVKHVKKRENITIYKTPLGYCAVEDELSAHGKTLREAIEDLTFKKLRNTDTSEIVEEVRKTGKVTRLQYRAITGACRAGTEAFCNRNNIKEEQEEISLEELAKILIPGKDYGAETFWDLIDNEVLK